MTELERAVAYALRLSESAAAKLLPEIQRNIETAKQELVRSGVDEKIALDESNNLMMDAVITFCQIRMGDESNMDRYTTAFQYQQDNLRKS